MPAHIKLWIRKAQITRIAVSRASKVATTLFQTERPVCESLKYVLRNLLGESFLLSGSIRNAYCICTRSFCASDGIFAPMRFKPQFIEWSVWKTVQHFSYSPCTRHATNSYAPPSRHCVTVRECLISERSRYTTSICAVFCWLLMGATTPTSSV
jgi:hypothetical protein